MDTHANVGQDSSCVLTEKPAKGSLQQIRAPYVTEAAAKDAWESEEEEGSVDAGEDTY